MILPQHVVSSSAILSALDDTSLSWQCDAFELTVRNYTHNSFKVRGSRVDGPVENGSLVAVSRWYAVGDRVEVQGGYTLGLYTVTAITSQQITLDRPLDADEDVSMWKVEYPADVIMGMVKILEYENDPSAKRTAGVASESLSRHSVSYDVAHNATSSRLDYPARLTAFLKAHVKARF